MISYEDFAKIELRVAEVLSAEKVDGADKLLKLRVRLGEEERTIVAGIALSYQCEELVGKKIIVLTNLEARKLKGIESQGMLLAAGESADKISVLTLDKEIEVGTRVY